MPTNSGYSTSTQPVYPQAGGYQLPQQDSGGFMDFAKNNAGSVLDFIGNFLGGMSDAKAKKAAIEEQGREFNLNYGLNRNTQEMAAQNALNRAPVADKAQYLAMNFSAPAPFQPRDYTQGLSQIAPGRTAQGGAQAQLAANAAVVPNYRQGAGGVDTSTTRQVLSNLTGIAPTTGTATYSYGGKQYTPQEWSAFLNQHPEIARTGV